MAFKYNPFTDNLDIVRSVSFLDANYLRLDTTNSPLTGDLGILDSRLAVGNDITNSFTINTSVFSGWMTTTNDSDLGKLNQIFSQASNINVFGAITVYLKARGNYTTPLLVQDDDTLGTVFACGYDGTDYAVAAGIEFEVDGVAASDDMPGRIVFSTTPAGTNTSIEAMRINSDQTTKTLGRRYNISSQTTDYTATVNDEIITVDTTGGDVTITLPPLTGITGQRFHIKKIDSVSNKVVVDGDGTETIDGSETQDIIFQYDSMELVAGSSEWHIV